MKYSETNNKIRLWYFGINLVVMKNLKQMKWYSKVFWDK